VQQIRRKKPRIGSAESGILRKQSTCKNEVWGLDFIFDRTADGQPIKMLLVVLDEYTRENIALEVSRKLKSHDVIMVLDELTAIRGAPENIRSDNGSEFIAEVMKEWCKESGTNTLYIEPGAPWQNGIVESFNSRLCDELLSSEIFTTLAEARFPCARWRADYNHRRPQRALGKQTPAEYAAKSEVSAARRLMQRMEITGNTRKAASIMTAEIS
jgi:putative transposase